jgi:hypothetical protein
MKPLTQPEELRVPFWGASRPVTVQGSALQATDPWSNAPKEQDGWTPPDLRLYPEEMHVRAHEEPDAKVAPSTQAESRATFVGTDRLVTVQDLALQDTAPGLNVPSVQDG